jgi:hypothetical protein
METFSFVADVISVVAAVFTVANTFALYYFGRRVWFKANESDIIQKIGAFGSELGRVLAPTPENILETKTILRRLSSELGALNWALGGASERSRKKLQGFVSEALNHDKLDDEMKRKLQTVYIELTGLEHDLRLMAEQKKVSP